VEWHSTSFSSPSSQDADALGSLGFVFGFVPPLGTIALPTSSGDRKGSESHAPQGRGPCFFGLLVVWGILVPLSGKWRRRPGGLPPKVGGVGWSIAARGGIGIDAVLVLAAGVDALTYRVCAGTDSQESQNVGGGICGNFVAVLGGPSGKRLSAMTNVNMRS